MTSDDKLRKEIQLPPGSLLRHSPLKPSHQVCHMFQTTAPAAGPANRQCQLEDMWARKLWDYSRFSTNCNALETLNENYPGKSGQHPGLWETSNWFMPISLGWFVMQQQKTKTCTFWPTPSNSPTLPSSSPVFVAKNSPLQFSFHGRPLSINALLIPDFMPQFMLFSSAFSLHVTPCSPSGPSQD